MYDNNNLGGPNMSKKAYVSFVLIINILFVIYLLWNLGISIDEQLLVSDFSSQLLGGSFTLAILAILNAVALYLNLFRSKTKL